MRKIVFVALLLAGWAGGCVPQEDGPTPSGFGDWLGNDDDTTGPQAPTSCGIGVCDLNATCDDSTGVAVCTCEDGYEGDGASCADVDECATGVAACDTEHGICVDTPGSYVCACESGWALDDDGVTCVDDTPPTYTAALALGEFHSCHLDESGALSCWGDNVSVQCAAPAGAFTSIAAEAYGTCAISDVGEMVCWGDSYVGTTGGPGPFVGVAKGEYFRCGLVPDGTVECVSEDAPSGSTFEQIDAGGLDVCGVRSDGTVACAGQTLWSPSQTETFVQVSVGALYACGIKTDGTLECWGHGPMIDAGPTDTIFKQLSAGVNHACGITEDDTVICWGADGFGQATPPSGTFQQVAAGGWHSCAIATSGDVVCWGRDDSGQSSP